MLNGPIPNMNSLGDCGEVAGNETQAGVSVITPTSARNRTAAGH